MDRWKCWNRMMRAGNSVPANPEVCRRLACYQLREIPVDQEPEPFLRCLQAPDGDLKAEEFRHLWEALDSPGGMD